MKTLIFLFCFMSSSVFAQSENLPKFTFLGDLRVRFQGEKSGSQDERKQMRLQAHFGTSVLIHEELTVTLRLKTGSSANSGNQTAGDDKSAPSARRTFGLDLAHLEYRPIQTVKIFAGRNPSPFVFAGKNQMLLDRDITFEGLASKYSQTFAESHTTSVNIGTFFLRENFDSVFGQDQTDNMLNGLQLHYKFEPESKAWNLSVGYGQFSFTSLKDTNPTTLMKDSTATFRGNTADLSGNYAHNFDVQQWFVEGKGKVEDYELGLFYEALKNTSADRLNSASSYGVILAKKPVTLTYTIQKIEKDAVFALLTDSDFAGGEASSKGSIVSLAWAITNKTSLALSQWNNQSAIDTAVPTDYRRTHLDLTVNF